MKCAPSNINDKHLLPQLGSSQHCQFSNATFSSNIDSADCSQGVIELHVTYVKNKLEF